MVGFGRNLVEIDPRSLPDLFKQLRDQNDRKKHKKNEIQNLEQIISIYRKIGYDCLTLSTKDLLNIEILMNIVSFDIIS